MSATSKPPVTATPLIAPISGFVCGGSAPRNGSAAVVVALPTSAKPSPCCTSPGAELLQVDAGAERGIGAGEDHHVDVVVVVAAR